MRAQNYLRLSDLQKYLKKQYNVVFESNQSYYNLLKEAGITWKKTQNINPAKNDKLVKAKKINRGTIGQIEIINRSWKACSVYGWLMSLKNGGSFWEWTGNKLGGWHQLV